MHSVAFSPSGNKIAWVGHDSSISVQSGGAKDVATLKGEFLPFLSCIWITENTLVAAGNNFCFFNVLWAFDWSMLNIYELIHLLSCFLN